MALTDGERLDNVIDLDIKGIQRTNIRINGRDDSILSLNLSDINLIPRLQKSYEKIEKSLNALSKIDIKSADFEADVKAIDKSMREVVDYIFDAPVSEVCCKQGTMFDLKDGEYTFEHIIGTLLELYGKNMTNEFDQMKKRIKKHTDKYIPEDHKAKSKKVEKNSK